MCRCSNALRFAALSFFVCLLIPTQAHAIAGSATGSGLPALNQDFSAEEDDVEECSSETADDAGDAAGDYAKECIKQCSPKAAKVECSVSEATDFHSVSHSFLMFTWTNVACTRHLSCTCECIEPVQKISGSYGGDHTAESVIVINGEKFTPAQFFGLIGDKGDEGSGEGDVKSDVHLGSTTVQRR